MPTSAPMSLIGSFDGRGFYLAEAGRFERPGVYFWNGVENVNVTDLIDAHARLDKLINSPETASFLAGVRNEVAHQVERWGTVHDRAKEPADWFWLVGYLAGKALSAHKDGDVDKALHHCISTAAVLANWHLCVKAGAAGMQPGSSDLQDFLRETFGANFVEAQGDREPAHVVG